MAKRRQSSKQIAQSKGPNWMLIFGVVAVGLIAIGALLALSLREPDQSTIAAYCLENEDNCSISGSADAKVTIVEVSDYGCDHCRDFNLQTAGLLREQYVDTGIVRWITLPFALFAQTETSVKAAFCAKDQGEFDEYHHALFEIQSTPLAHTRDGLIETARILGLNTEEFTSCFDSGTHDKQIQSNLQIASLRGVTSTPTFFVNDRVLNGNYPFDAFQAEISRALDS